MSRRALIVIAAVAALGGWIWHAQLFTVSRPGEKPLALELLPDSARRPCALDAVLPAVPVGMRHLKPGGGVMLVHYWAPWERNGRPQAMALDSLRRERGLEALDVVVVCFDPFPSVARFVGRNRLRLSVLLDQNRATRSALPCPSVPYTYAIDREGRIAIAQSGEVDWFAPGTRASLERLLAEPPAVVTERPAAAL